MENLRLRNYSFMDQMHHFCELKQTPYQTFSKESTVFKPLKNFCNAYGGKSGPINNLRRALFCEKKN